MHTTNLSREGRVLIPADVRRSLGFKPGETLSLSVVDGEVRITGRMTALRKMQQRLARHGKLRASVVSELLAERRAEAARE
ncbi:MAG: AbrB/MazE/SpoVT family DNA-binding domain-containing protein [Proteobacteria bacterium]|nr:AbrB/MazE/SpoVT family DNA-binding domain-containing protein [Pseudomonadota bacterium]